MFYPCINIEFGNLFTEYFVPIITVTLAIFLYERENKRTHEIALRDKLNEILKIAFEHPYLENPDFIAKWSPKKYKKDKRYEKYEIYAILIFNHLEDLAKYCKYKPDRMSAVLDYESWALEHKWYWLKPSSCNENEKGYNKKFVTIINKLIQEDK